MGRFQRAVKTNARLRLGFVGPAGSGKTYSSLRVARALVGPEGRIAVIDSERGSASKYAKEFAFDVLELESHGPEVYVQALNDAAAEGYDIVIVDSLSHAWMGRDGALERVDKKTKASSSKNSFTAWRDITPQHNAMVDAILASPLHVIATMRTKTEWLVEDVDGKKKPIKVGTQPVQREGLDYEFDVVADLEQDNNLATFSKTRCSELKGKILEKPGEDLAEILKAWIAGEETPFQRVLDLIQHARSQADLELAGKSASALSKEDRDRLKPIYARRRDSIANTTAAAPSQNGTAKEPEQPQPEVASGGQEQVVEPPAGEEVETTVQLHLVLKAGDIRRPAPGDLAYIASRPVDDRLWWLDGGSWVSIAKKDKARRKQFEGLLRDKCDEMGIDYPKGADLEDVAHDLLSALTKEG